ncbi:MAG: cytidylyltransferase domain-containing protein [Bacillota bacterium]
MIDGKRILAVIPARGGSKGIPRKNIRIVAGKPLIAWTIVEARKSKYIDRMILSSDDKEIISVAESWGCEAPFVRPAELAQDDTPGIEPVLHAIQTLPAYDYDYVVLLQPTSPLRTVSDIDGCIEYCLKQRANACVTVTEQDKSPYWMFTLDYYGRIHSLICTEKKNLRRQDLPVVYSLNGAVYIARIKWLLENKSFTSDETLAYVMPCERALDIDTEYHLRIFEFLIEDQNKTR